MCSQWLLSASVYAAAGLASAPEEPGARRERPRERAWPVADGPASRLVDAWLRPQLPAGVTRCTCEDYGDPPATAATLRYRGRTGGYLRVVRRQLRVPLLLDGLVDSTPGHWVHRRTGSCGHVLRNDDVAKDTYRLVLVSADGMFLLIESVGIPGARTPAPMSGRELDALAATLDRQRRR